MGTVLKIATTKLIRDSELVADLEMLLSAAKSGKFTGIAYITIGLEGYEMGTGLAGSVKDDIYGSVGALEVLKQRLLARIQ